VSIDGQGPYRFLFDTGTSITVIDRSLAQQLEIAAVGQTRALNATGVLVVDQAILDDVRAGQISKQKLPVLISDLPRFRSHGHLDGILGMNFLAGAAFLIDVRHHCVEADVPLSRMDGGQRIDAEEIAGRVALKVKGASFVLDSGASFMILLSDRARGMASVSEAMEITSTARREQVRSAIVPRLTIGDLVFRDVPAAVVAQQRCREDALLPINIFSTVYVDAARELVILNGELR
jgi:predicted aspartyl protease